MDTSKELKPNGSLNVISFCSGYGGIERGLDLVGVNHRVLAYVEIESFAIANLVNKMESGELDAAPIYTDLKTFPSHLFRGCVDILTGGYPCQPFSAAGRRRGEDDPRHLWPYIREHINAIEPLQCFFENVEGHISLGLNSVLSDMEEDGYDSTWGIFSASEVGAPHQRKRVFILANSSSAGRQQITRSAHENESEHEGRSKVQTDITSGHGERRRERAMATPQAVMPEQTYATWKARMERKTDPKSKNKKVPDNLAIAVKMWPTPTVQDSNKATKKLRDNHQNNLTAIVFNQQLPTPTSRDWKGGYAEKSLTRKDGKSRRFDALPNAAIGG